MQMLELAEVVAQFGLDGATISHTEAGRIHDTSIAEGIHGKWIVQRINTDIFDDPEVLMDNAIRTRDCVVAAGGLGLEYRRTTSGDFLLSTEGAVWRSYRFVEGVVTKRPSDTSAVDWVATAFGWFDAALQLHDASDWHEVLPRFHDHGRRVADLHAAIRLDPVGRASLTAGHVHALDNVIDRLEGLDEFEAWAEAPVRAVHHDAKSVNAVAGDGGRVTILDLDTVMAGTILSDIGELVRSCARGTPDNREGFVVDHARHAISGFLAGWNENLSDAERRGLPIAGLMMTIQNACRFMTDHILGDQYYTNAPGRFPNLGTARSLTQFAQAQLSHLDDLRRYAATV